AINGQADDERCTDAGLALDLDEATVFVNDDGSGYRQPLPGAPTDFLCCEEWVEDFVDILFWNAAAIVRKLNPHPIPYMLCCDADAASPRFLAGFPDRVRGIDDEIEEDLVDLPNVADHIRQLA